MDDDQPPAQAEKGDKPIFQWSGTGHAPAEDHDSPSGDEDDPQSPHDTKVPAPVQKRRRVTRACDECRRKKIKCDGKQPCTHCTVYSYECTYDQPSNRRRNPTPQYIETLENKLHRAEIILKACFPNIDLNDPNIANTLLQGGPALKPQAEAAPSATAQGKAAVEGERDSLLESMVQDTGSLDLDDEGHWDFHGHSSGMVFLQRLRQQLGDMFPQAEGSGTMLAKPRHYVPKSFSIDSPKSTSESPFDANSTSAVELPPKEQGKYFCELSMGDACSLMRFIHKPTLWQMFDRVYDTPENQWGNEEHRYLPLIFALMAVGTMFATSRDSRFRKEGYAATLDDGFKWFKAARSLMEITDCRDVPSLQAVVCLIMFLQSTAKLSTCWCYVGIALHSAIRMGLHRSITASFNPVELESRRRLFWQIRKMDVYVGAMIGLPTMLSNDDIDQDMPLDLDDEYITPEKVLQAPSGHIHLMAGSNAQTRLMNVLRKVIKYVYPIKGIQYLEGKPRSYVVSHARIREVERDLQHWMEELPMFLRPGGAVSPELARVQQLLRMAYAYVQMFLYRPFLHYMSKSSHHPSTDKRSYACAAACVSVSRNVIHITQEMSKRGLLIGSFWFVMYTTFLAIMALVFYALENPDSKSSEEIIQDATMGKQILARLAKNSMAADRCTQTLGQLFDKLPERLKRGRAQSLTAPAQKKRQAVSPAPARSASTNSPAVKHENFDEDCLNPQRASTFPVKQTSTSYAQPQYASALSFNDPFPQSSSVETASSTLGLTPDASTRASATDSPAFSQIQMGFPPTSKQGLPQTTTYGLPDLSAMMFPTNDPFAYPNQPMTTLETVAFADTPNSSGGDSTSGGSRHSIPSPSQQQGNPLYSIAPQNSNLTASGVSGSGSVSNAGAFDPSIEAQIFDPLQPFLSGGAYGQEGIGEMGFAGMGGPEGVLGAGGKASEEGFADWWGQAGAGAGGWVL